MERERHLQLELFSQGQKSYGRTRAQTPNNYFFSYLRNYEKIILIIIGLVVTSIISFSLGIEKGKRLTRSEEIATPKIQVHPTMEKQDITKPGAPRDSLQYYTIQLASYQNKTSAQKETQELKRKGLLPLILSKGRYTIVCVGNFSNREIAQSLLFELKKRYRDCFIRRL